MIVRNWRVFFVCLALCVISLALYAPVGGFDFVHLDDPLYITQEKRVLSGLSWENVLSAFTKSHANFWHPLTTISLMLDAELFGVNPAGFHVTNVVLHTANSLLLFWVLWRFTWKIWCSGRTKISGAQVLIGIR